MFGKKQRGQAALEYLSTYGWAVLVIAVVIVALAWLGIFNVKVPDRCAFQPGLECIDVRIGNDQWWGNVVESLIVANRMKETVYVCQVRCVTDLNVDLARYAVPNECASSTSATPSTSGVIVPGEQKDIAQFVHFGNCNEVFGGQPRQSSRAVGSKYSGTLAVFYSIAADAGSGGKARMIQGDLVATIQP